MTTPDIRQLPEAESVPKTAFLVEAPLVSLAIAVLAIFLFAWLADSVVDKRTLAFDSWVRAAIHAWSSPPLTRLMFAISFMGKGGLIAIALLAFALFRHFHWRRAAIWLVVTLAGSLVLELTLKSAFHRPRPVPFFGPNPMTYAFPSGHALFSFCFYGVLAGLLTGRVRSLPARILIWLVTALLVLAIGLSRIYLGVHTPSDVIAGYLTGTIWAATMVALDRWRQQRKNRA
ncbi:MAG: phosphatase PAP2 family protein [Acidobacteriia bacterium]|nr:phosphatase PAP2 family protein [Terriglobia bacterium]